MPINDRQVCVDVVDYLLFAVYFKLKDKQTKNLVCISCPCVTICGVKYFELNAAMFVCIYLNVRLSSLSFYNVGLQDSKNQNFVVLTNLLFFYFFVLIFDDRTRASLLECTFGNVLLPIAN